MPSKNWTLLAKRDVSPHKWFPIEMRTYKLPNGRIVDDFSVTTLGDVSMIVPITKDKKVILVNQFKPGAGEVVLEFPAGRIEAHHKDFVELAQKKLERVKFGLHKQLLRGNLPKNIFHVSLLLTK